MHKAAPFVIRLRDRTVEQSHIPGVQVGVDPGSKATGMAVFTTDEDVDTTTGEVATVRDGVWLGELVHRGLAIKKKMASRAAYRRRRRSANLRYRAPRLDNRTRPAGWLPPSLRHRVETTAAWIDRLRRWAPVTGLHVERVRFDTHAMVNPEVARIEYQRGTLFGFEVREYLLAKYARTCAYCDVTDVALNIDHVVPRSAGGSDRVANLALSCVACNQAKSNRPVEEFLAHDPARLARVKARSRTPLRDAAAVNTTRWALWRVLVEPGLSVEAGSGARTKYNRTGSGVPKTHALDALCVGEADRVSAWPAQVQVIGCAGRGTYARGRPDKHGFPRLLLTRRKHHFGFATGDLVHAVVPAGKKTGTHTGRVAVRASGKFNITGARGTVQGIHYRHVRLTQRGDGYTYHTRKEASGMTQPVVAATTSVTNLNDAAPPGPEGPDLRRSPSR